jgi:hypothetical protein
VAQRRLDGSIKSSTYAIKRSNFQGVQLSTFFDGTLNVRGDKDRGRSLEVAIPWASFEELSPRPEPGTVWTATFNRWDGVEPDRRLSIGWIPWIAARACEAPSRFAGPTPDGIGTF